MHTCYEHTLCTLCTLVHRGIRRCALVADSGNSAIRRISLASDEPPDGADIGLTTTIAGLDGPGYADGPVPEARFDRPDRVQLSFGRVCAPYPAGASAGAGTTVCVACTPGTSSSAVGAAAASKCRACAPGTFSDAGGLLGPSEFSPCCPGRLSPG